MTAASTPISQWKKPTLGFVQSIPPFVETNTAPPTPEKTLVSDILIFLGHPFSALIIAALLAIYFLEVLPG